MKRVGLCIQYDGVDNYGTILQAYATVKMIEGIGCEPILIKYKRRYTLPFIIQQLPRTFSIRFWKAQRRGDKRRRDIRSQWIFREYMEEKEKAFRTFRESFFSGYTIDKYYGYDELKKGSTNYDTVLVGSDQLWLPDGLATNFYNLMFVDDNVNKVSYATSFGVSSIPYKQYKATREYLRRIDFLSVREEAGKKIIAEIAERDAFVACDPVMLMDRKEWVRFADSDNLPPQCVKGEYLLCYFLGGSKAERNCAKKVAEGLGLKIVNIRFVEDYYEIDETFGDIHPKGISPQQFVKLIKEASCIMTDSFHGTAFSIIFEKQFISLYRFENDAKYSKNSRIDNILKRLGLEDRLVTEKDPLKCMQGIIDYKKISQERENWRMESELFLKNALGE